MLSDRRHELHPLTAVAATAHLGGAILGYKAVQPSVLQSASQCGPAEKPCAKVEPRAECESRLPSRSTARSAVAQFVSWAQYPTASIREWIRQRLKAGNPVVQDWPSRYSRLSRLQPRANQFAGGMFLRIADDRHASAIFGHGIAL